MKRFFLIFLLLITTGLTAQQTRILIGSPIRQKPAILREFLESLNTLDQTNLTFDYCFVDDNTDNASQALLQAFAKAKGDHCFILSAGESQEGYDCNEITHIWKDETVWKVAAFKDWIIQRACAGNYDYLFLIDSDLVLHPATVKQLLAAQKEIVSNIFWTSWYPDSPLQPQVWLSDQYTFYSQEPGENLTEEEKQCRAALFVATLKMPGTYEVGGLGACTLISKQALDQGVNFKRLHNVSFWGEDRHFCIRAVALGLKLYVDTHYPAYHIYRESYLSGVEAFKKECGYPTQTRPRVTLAMLVHNEADRYLRPVLESAREYITDAVIIDDASTDNSATICQEVLAGIPLKLIRNETSLFANEWTLRQQLWDETVKTDPEWILVLDADEIFEDRMKTEIKHLVSDTETQVYYFRLYDFWDEGHYRSDEWWSAHERFAPFLIHYDASTPYQFVHTPQHCGRLPLAGLELKGICSDLRIKHYGWAKLEDRMAKHARYKALDPDGRYGWQAQYDSILDPEPHLMAWIE